jgi:O-antigen/teichoic acid export membrane protein
LYLLPTLALRGISVLLTPLYTRLLSPAEYATLGVANTVIPLLVTLFGGALQSAMVRLYQRKPDERAELLGGAVVFVTLVPVGWAALIDAAGAAGLLDRLFAGITYHPGLRLAVWTAAAQGIGPLATAVLTAEERPARVAVINTAVVVGQLLSSIYLVVVLRAGLAGVLGGSLCGAVVGTCVGAVTLRSRLRLGVRSIALLGASLRYSLPLVPHLMASWGLSLGDRVVLERYVEKVELARYTLAYLFSLAVSVFCGAVTQALHPMLTRVLLSGDPEGIVPTLGTRAVGAMCFVAATAVCFAPEVVAVLAPPVYASSLRFVPWVVLGALFQGTYWVASFGVWYKMDSRAVPFITGGVAVLALAANVLTVPRFGAAASAVITAIAYGLLALVHGINAARVHPIPWRYDHWFILVTGAALMSCVALALPAASPVAVLVKVALLAACGYGGFRLLAASRPRAARGEAPRVAP